VAFLLRLKFPPALTASYNYRPSNTHKPLWKNSTNKTFGEFAVPAEGVGFADVADDGVDALFA
jgi:lipoate synthase